MPKRGGNGNGRQRNFRERNNDHFEHDDRGSNNTRRVSFKSGITKGKQKFNKINNFAQLLDDDIEMGATGNANRQYKSNMRGRGSRINNAVPRHISTNRKFMPGHLPWYQITIPYGGKHDKDTLLRALLSFMSPEIFIPHYYRVQGNAAIFFVDEVKIAEKLYNASRQITMLDGFKLIIIVKNAYPTEKIDENLKELMKQVIAKRYNAPNKALDLTKFHSDPDLSEFFCALFRPAIMLAAIDIIAKNIPDLEALNLNDNKLYGSEHMRTIPLKLKCIKILYLGDNKITHSTHLEHLKTLPLVELYLKGNPFIDRMPDHETYVSDIRKKFPKLLKLDGVDLPKTIGFDVADDIKMPKSQQSFLVDPQGQDMVREFLTQYFAIYDSESRQPLLEAYHDNASLSMTANYHQWETRNTPNLRLNSYISNSRNLLRVSDRESRRRFLKTGKLPVVSFLSELPKTKHDLMGFTVDLTLCRPTMMLLTVNGAFKEPAVRGEPTRSFHRTFVIVPNGGGGFCITNDLLHITNTTVEQEDHIFQSEVPLAAPAAPIVVQQPASVLGESEKLQLINALGQQTGMNNHWSMNCLQETNWDLQRAFFIFNQLQSEGKIPPEAFIK